MQGTTGLPGANGSKGEPGVPGQQGQRVGNKTHSVVMVIFHPFM